MEELRKTADTICISETIFDGQAEQGVELDYVLPDYYPEIFRILCCRLTPRIMSYSISGDSKLLLDSNVDIKVLYLAEGSNDIHCIEQKYTYTKTVDIGKNAVSDPSKVMVKLSTRADYCNCRAVSGRRIDVRGAVSTKVHISSNRSVSIPRMPENIQVKEALIRCCGNIAATEKQFSVREEIETGASGIGCIIRTSAVPKVSDVRIISDKAVIKGQITVNAAYGIHRDEQGFSDIERMTADIPVSQIVELQGIDENHSYTADIDVLNCELNSSTDSGIISCNLLAVCRISCCKDAEVSVPVDVFSTEFETEHSMKQIRVIGNCSAMDKQFTLKNTLSAEGNEIDGVWDCSADVYNTSCSVAQNGELKLSGNIGYQAMCRNSDGIPCLLEKQDSFEQAIPISGISPDSITDISVTCTDADHTIRPDGTLEISAVVQVCGTITGTDTVSIADSIVIHEDKRRQHDNSYALRICYANGAEDSWDIAKRYGTPVNSILSENDIHDRDEKLSGMILIPTI